MKKYQIGIAVTLVFCIALVVLSSYQFDAPAPKDSNGKASLTETNVKHEVAPDTLAPTAEQKRFAEKILLPAIADARLHYPVELIREKFNTCLLRVESGQIKMDLSTTNPPNGPAMAGAFKREDGQLMMLLCVPSIMDAYAETRAYPDSWVDALVAVILHEEFHLIEQGGHLPDELSKEQLIESESEAWWYTVSELYHPMIEAGRLTICDNVAKDALTAYDLAKGDRHHQAWVKFSRSAIGANAE